MRIQLRSAATTLAAVALAIGPVTLATPAVARQNAQVDKTASTAVTSAANKKKSCRWVDRTGSNARERICLTREEWKRVDEYMQKSF